MSVSDVYTRAPVNAGRDRVWWGRWWRSTRRTPPSSVSFTDIEVHHA